MLKQAGLNPIVVHGGGPQIGAMLNRLGIKSEFSGGLRITDKATVEIVEMVLAGSINKQIVAQLSQAGGRAVGLCGKDGNLIVARKVEQKIHDPESNIEKILDLGFVGEPAKINPEILEVIQKSDIIPVIAPIMKGSASESTRALSRFVSPFLVVSGIVLASLALNHSLRGLYPSAAASARDAISALNSAMPVPFSLDVATMRG